MSWTLRARFLSFPAALVALALCANAAARANEFRLIDDFSEAGAEAAAYAAKFGAERVLLVVDIDNTLLAMDEPLGSEQWFDWQVFLLKNEPDSPDLVADSFPGILKAQGRLYDRGQMHAVQADLPEIVAEIQQSGAAAVVLTSRGEEFRAATERELVRNGFDFARSPLATRDEEASLYMPYDPAEPAEAGISAREVSMLKLEKPQQVSYRNGIMMTSGQHKGIMLVTLLHRAAEPVKAVIFVDNRADHVAGVVEQMREMGIAATGLVYQREDDNIKAFAYGSKEVVAAQWRKLNRSFEVERQTVRTSASAPAKSGVSGRRLHRRLFCR